MLARPALSARVGLENVCLRCSLGASRQNLFTARRGFTSSLANFAIPKPRQDRRSAPTRQYFSANAAVYHVDAFQNIVQGTRLQKELGQEVKAARTEQESKDADVSIVQQPAEQDTQLDRRKTTQSEAPSNPPASTAYPIRPDAPSRLTSLSSALPKTSLRRRFALFLSLSKPNLSFLIVLTTAAAYAIYPVNPLLTSTANASPTLSALTLVFLTSGTALCSASANALNMLFEPEHDAKMSRTRNRPLVRGLLSKRAALLFAIATGLVGTAALYSGVNPTVAGLGALNIFLYAGVYTPMKRISVLNTWVGAIVGGIPPLMGWAAAAGQAATGDGGPADLLLGEKNIGGWLLAALLFAWQFPHFNALSWGIRDEYKAAGYRMLVSFKPKMNARVALRYSLLMFPICFGLSAYGVTDSYFVLTSSVINAWMTRAAIRFWQFEGHKGTARGLFWASVWHLPVVMVLAMAHKKGLWMGLWQRIFGEEEDDEDEWIEEAVETLVAGDKIALRPQPAKAQPVQ